MKNKNSRKLWCVLLALSLVLTSSLMLGVSAEEILDSSTESTQPVEPSEPGNGYDTPEGEGGTAPDNNDGDASEGDNNGAAPEGGNDQPPPVAPPTQEGDDQEGGDATDTPSEPAPTQGTEGLIYTLNAAGTQYSVTGYEGTAVHVVIPVTYGDLPVTRVNKDAFASSTQGGNGAVELPSDNLRPRGVMPTATTATANGVKLQSITLLSPTVILEDSKNTIPTGVAVYGYLGSTAESYAAKYNRTFAALDGLVFELNAEGTAYVVKNYTGEQTKVTVPAAYLGLPVTEIGEGAFILRSDITEIVLPDSITHIGDSAFYRSGLKSFTVSENVVYIGLCAFSTENMETLVVEPGNSVYCSYQNCIIEMATCTLIAGCKTSVIPDNGIVTVIGEGAFARCPLTSIAIPDAITTIEYGAFSECDKLESVTFGPNSQLTSIGEHAFHENCALTAIALPESLVTIGAGAFYCCCGLEKITLGAALESIGEQAFVDCDGLTDIIIRSENVEIFDDEYTLSETAVIYGYADSTAQDYAEKYGREFVELAPYTPGDIDGKEGVTTDDAIYLLYHLIIGGDNYLVDQECDFNGDDLTDINDAIYLLYHAIIGEDNYPLN